MLLGVTGKARSGKDTFAEMLAEELFNLTQKKFVLMAYATELKLRVQRDFDLSYEQLWGGEKEVEDKRYPKGEGFWSAREILQSYGEYFRSVDKLFWVNNLFKVIEEKEYSNVIVTDVRYPNEADPIKERSGYILRVTSDRNCIQKIHGENHISETAMDTYKDNDLDIINDWGLVELREAAKDAAKFLLELSKM